MSLENARQRVQENLHPLLRRQTRRHADHRSASVEAMAVSECGDPFCARLEDFDRWRDDLHLVGEPAQKRRIGREVFGVRDHAMRGERRQPVHQADHRAGDSIERPRRQRQVTVIGERRRLAVEAAAKGDPRRIELRKMEAHDVGGAYQSRGHPSERRHDDTLAHAPEHGNAYDPHTVAELFERCGGIEARRQHGHLVPARVRAVIGENDEDPHVPICPRLSTVQSWSRRIPSSTSTVGRQSSARIALRTSET